MDRYSVGVVNDLFKFYLQMEGDQDDGWLLLCYLNPTDTDDYWWYESGGPESWA